ncbi:SDR family NAD(P)-dependent oxidoreductase [Thermodesulfobacteriota bacterium]
MKLEGKVAIITGGGTGIGRVTAISLAKEGAKVVVVGRREEKIESAAEEIKAQGGVAMSIKGDVTSNNNIRTVVQETLERFGKTDILVNNAGYGLTGRFGDGTMEEWNRVIEINLMGTILFTRAIIDAMIQQKSGKIINVSSESGRPWDRRASSLFSVQRGCNLLYQGLGSRNGSP